MVVDAAVLLNRPDKGAATIDPRAVINPSEFVKALIVGMGRWDPVQGHESREHIAGTHPYLPGSR